MQKKEDLQDTIGYASKKNNGFGDTSTHNGKFSLAENKHAMDESKARQISDHLSAILEIIGLNVDASNIEGTPGRIAELYIKEVFSGLNPQNKPLINLSENNYHYNQTVMEKNIPLYTWSEQYFLPIIGKLHFAYLSKGKIIGGKALNSVVRFHCSKPQTEGQLIDEIAHSLKEILGTQDMAIIMDTVHSYAGIPGNNGNQRNTITTHYSGKFQNEDTRREFFLFLGSPQSL